MIDSDNSILIGTHNNHDVFLSEEGGKYWLCFGTQVAHKYWFNALENLLKSNPDHVFVTPDDIKIEVKELSALIAKTRTLLTVL